MNEDVWAVVITLAVGIFIGYLSGLSSSRPPRNRRRPRVYPAPPPVVRSAPGPRIGSDGPVVLQFPARRAKP